MRKHSVAHGSVNKLNKVKFFGLLIKIQTPVKIGISENKQESRTE